MKYVMISLCILPFAFTACDNQKNEPKSQKTTSGKVMTKTKTATGLEYEIITPGTGATPIKGKPVTVHYTGWLNDGQGNAGQKFDSSHDRAQPFTFVIGMGQVIRGWDEGVMGMTIGEVRRLYIPAALGYGARGAGRIIPANADLIFDVELLKV